VSLNDLVVACPPSLNVMLMVAVPVMLVAGIIRRARLLPVPPMTMFSFGTKDVLEELAMRNKLSSGSRLSRLNGIGPAMELSNTV